MSAAPVLVEEAKDLGAPGVYVVKLNRPDKLNALSVEVGEVFAQQMNELAQRPGLRAVVLTGAGRAFSAGGDLDFLRARAEDSPARNEACMLAFYRRFLTVRALPVPCVAAINGHAIGAGMCLALACDLRVVAAGAKLGLTFVGLGLHPGLGATHFLPRVAGPEVAARLLLTGETVRGADAERLRLAHETAPDAEQCVARALAIAAELARAGPVAVQTTTRTLRGQLDAGLDAALLREAAAQAQAYASADYREGVRAIAAGEAPTFTGC